MNLNGFRIKLIQETKADKATDELNEYLHYCDKNDIEVRDVTFHAYVVAGGVTVYAYVVKFGAYSAEEIQQYHIRNLKERT